MLGLGSEARAQGLYAVTQSTAPYQAQCSIKYSVAQGTRLWWLESPRYGVGHAQTSCAQC